MMILLTSTGVIVPPNAPYPAAIVADIAETRSALMGWIPMPAGIGPVMAVGGRKRSTRPAGLGTMPKANSLVAVESLFEIVLFTMTVSSALTRMRACSGIMRRVG